MKTFILFLILTVHVYAGPINSQAVYKTDGSILLRDMPQNVTDLTFRTPHRASVGYSIGGGNPYITRIDQIFPLVNMPNDYMYSVSFHSDNGFVGKSLIDRWGIPGLFDLGILMAKHNGFWLNVFEDERGQEWEDMIYDGDGKPLVHISFHDGIDTHYLSFGDVQHTPEPKSLAIIFLGFMGILIVTGFRKL